MSSPLHAIEAAIERAQASASRLEQAHKNSIRPASDRATQQHAAEKAAAIVADLQEAHAALAAVLEAIKTEGELRALSAGKPMRQWRQELSAVLRSAFDRAQGGAP